MKTLKSARQKNIMVNSAFYTIADLNKMFESHIIFRFDENFKEDYSLIISYSDLEESCVRLFLETVKELKVVYNKEYDFYETVAVLNSGELIHVSL